ncbi:hypothetical protein M404DRAFT_998290, partial [Pisolithus tinctorius Marx 270]
MPRSAVEDHEIKELLVRRKLLHKHGEEKVNIDLFGFHFIDVEEDTRTDKGYLAYCAHYLQAQSAQIGHFNYCVAHIHPSVVTKCSTSCGDVDGPFYRYSTL